MRGDRPIEDVCKGCNLRHTKPGSQPPELLAAIASTLELDEVRGLGAHFTWPDGLSSAEWAGLRALERARKQFEHKRNQRERREAEQQRLAGLVKHR